MAVIRELAKTKTVLLISHRLANVVGADQILVMERGRVINQGSHEVLMAEKDSYYSRLYMEQRRLEKYSAAGPEKNENVKSKERKEAAKSKERKEVGPALQAASLGGGEGI